ncbi:MAG: hypothetical protein WCJ42_10295 [Actinomycetes bacterium]
MSDEDPIGIADDEQLLPEPWLERGELPDFARMVTGSALLGLLAGACWAAFAPRVALVVTGHSVDFVAAEPSGFMGADAMFFAVVFVAGLVSGAIARWRVPRAGLGVVLGLVLGGLAGAAITAVTGSVIGHADPLTAAKHLADGVHLLAALKLRSLVAITGWPIGALVVWVSLDVRPVLHELLHPGG